MNLIFKNIKHQSKDYWKSAELRDQVLRKPLDLSFSKEELLAEDNQLHFLVTINDEIVGCFILVKVTDSKLKIRQVCINPSFQKKGIGTNMMQFAEKWAKENNYNQIYCHARNNALAFYQNLDYKIEGESFEEVGLKHYKLVKKI